MELEVETNVSCRTVQPRPISRRGNKLIVISDGVVPRLEVKTYIKHRNSSLFDGPMSPHVVQIQREGVAQELVLQAWDCSPSMPLLLPPMAY